MLVLCLGLHRLFDISVVLRGKRNGQWSRSSSAVVDEYGYGPDGHFVAFYSHSNDKNGCSGAFWDYGFANPNEKVPLLGMG